jgi:hypothetical protein
MYGPQGWTDRLIQQLERLGVCTSLRGAPTAREAHFLRFDHLQAETFLALLEHIPAENLDDAQNMGPPMRVFDALALQCPEAEFMGYVVSKHSDEERISLEGCWLPVEVDDSLLARYLPADEDDVVNGKRRLWWD